MKFQWCFVFVKFILVIKYYIFLSVLLLYLFHNNKMANIYHLLSGIYLLFWLEVFVSNILCPLFYKFFDSDVLIQFLFQIYFTKNNPLYNDPQSIWKCKWFFVTFTMAVNSPEPTISCFIALVVWLSSIYDQYVPSFGFVVFVVTIIFASMVIRNCYWGRDG